MFDANLLFYDGVTLTTATGSTVLQIKKTPADGVDVELDVTTITGTTGTLDVVVQHSDSSTTGFTTIATFPQITTTTGPRHLRVQTKKPFVKLTPTTGGTSPSFVVTAGIVSGPSAGYQTA